MQPAADYCSADLCSLTSHRSLELVGHAIHGRATALRTASFSLLLSAEQALRACIRERCPEHEYDRDALELLVGAIDAQCCEEA